MTCVGDGHHQLRWVTVERRSLVEKVRRLAYAGRGALGGRLPVGERNEVGRSGLGVIRMT